MNDYCDVDRAEVIAPLRGRVIAGLILTDNEMHVVLMPDGHVPEQTLRLWDAGQSCCESRYMTCDDQLETFKGAVLLGVDVVNHEVVEGSDVHEIQFAKIRTSLGDVTIESHNEHNGYYGGISLEASVTND